MQILVASVQLGLFLAKYIYTLSTGEKNQMQLTSTSRGVILVTFYNTLQLITKKKSISQISPE